MSYIFPKNLMAGFVERNQQKLAFITYIDPVKKQICSAKAFDLWRSKTIDIQTWENVPTSGFVVNKNVKRDGYFGGNEYIRVWHPMGFEFEVSIPVFERLINFVDISKGEILTPCVLGWQGQKVELISSLDPVFTDVTDNPDYKNMDLMKDMVLTNFEIQTLYDFKGITVMCLGYGHVIDSDMILYNHYGYANMKYMWFYNFDTQVIEQLKTRVKYLRHTEKTVTDEQMTAAQECINDQFVLGDVYNKCEPFGVCLNKNKFSSQILYRQMHEHSGMDEVNNGDAYVIEIGYNVDYPNSTKFLVTDGVKWYNLDYYGIKEMDVDLKTLKRLKIVKRKKLR